MRFRFHTADVFTEESFTGNPLAVFPEAEGLDTARMQAIAREMNLSETVFVMPPEDPRHTRRVRIFTPMAELPFAGHPTIGTVFVLASTGEAPVEKEITRMILEEGVGPVPVELHSKEGRPVFAWLSAAQAPALGPEPPAPAELASALTLAPEDLSADMAPKTVSCGVPFLFVALEDTGALGRARIDRAVWDRVMADFPAPQVFLCAFDPDDPEVDLRARMFAPAMGVEEDPATGAAAAALAGYLAPATPDGHARWEIAQGVEMGRRSRISVEADVSDGKARGVRVGGAAVMVTSGHMEVPG